MYPVQGTIVLPSRLQAQEPERYSVGRQMLALQKEELVV